MAKILHVHPLGWQGMNSHAWQWVCPSDIRQIENLDPDRTISVMITHGFSKGPHRLDSRCAVLRCYIHLFFDWVEILHTLEGEFGQPRDLCLELSK